MPNARPDRTGQIAVSSVAEAPVLMLDVNGDSFVTPLDVLPTIAYINASLDGDCVPNSPAPSACR